MKRRMWLAGALLALLSATPAKADTGIIIRTTLGLPALQTVCALPVTCTIVGGLDGTLGQVFLVTTPLDPTVFINSLTGGLAGFVDAEVNQILNLVDLTNLLPTPIPISVLADRSSVTYAGTAVWNSYANQPAASIVEVQNAQRTFSVTGTGIVADIDTGVDPNHPVLQPVLVPGDGYDFTRSQAGGSEMTDLTPSDFNPYPPQSCPSCQPATVNQSTAAVLDQSTAAVLDGNGVPNKYAAFGHGTMVMGIIHLVAPTAQLMPLKAFHSDGTASLSDILRAIYYGVQNNANIINMSFDTKTSSAELQKALDYANQHGVICAASAGNDGIQEIVYPAAMQNDVMGVASTSDQDTRSSFSNYGDAIVWVAAPGEAIVSTYPFSTYSAGWGTSFSTPFVSGGAALLRNLQASINESQAASAVGHAVALDPSLQLGKGRLDLMLALGSAAGTSGTPDYSVFATPSSMAVTAGNPAKYIVSASPAHGFNQTVTWSCTGAPMAASCTVSPGTVTLDGSNTATATVTLTTMARAASPPMFLPRGVPPIRRWWPLAAMIVCLAAAVMSWNLSRASRQQAGPAVIAGLIAVSLCTYSCGGYGSTPGSATLASLELSPSSVTGGSPSTGTVMLSAAAPSAGAVVSLSSSNTAAATVPSSVTVAAGATSATFQITTMAVASSTMVNISGYCAGVTKTGPLTVTSPSGTPTGTYTLTITGTSGNLSHATTATVTVN
jgi:Subtilase family